MTDPTFEGVKAALTEHSAKVVEFVANLIVPLGMSPEWSMEDNFETTELLAGLASQVGLPSAASQSADDLTFWRTVGEELGYDVEDDNLPWVNA